MAASTGPNAALKYGWAERESGWATDMNDNLVKLDHMAMSRVLDRDLTAPPGGPANGDAYIPKATATGAWAGQENKLAVWDGSAWRFYTPKSGWMTFVTDETVVIRYTGSAWVIYPAGGVAKTMWLPASAFGYNAMARDTPLDEGAYEYIALPAAGDTDLHTWWKVPDDFGALTAWDMYLIAMGTSTTNLTMNWTYVLAAAHDALADNLVGYQTLTHTVAPTSSERMVIKTGIALPTGPPTLTAGAVAKMVIRRYNAFDANPDDYRFVGVKMRYTTP